MMFFRVPLCASLCFNLCCIPPPGPPTLLCVHASENCWQQDLFCTRHATPVPCLHSIFPHPACMLRAAHAATAFHECIQPLLNTEHHKPALMNPVTHSREKQPKQSGTSRGKQHPSQSRVRAAAAQVSHEPLLFQGPLLFQSLLPPGRQLPPPSLEQSELRCRHPSLLLLLPLYGPALLLALQHTLQQRCRVCRAAKRRLRFALLQHLGQPVPKGARQGIE